jgi:IclR family acetate operon transcriptional repressor
MLSMLSDDEVRAILAKVGMPMVTPTTVTEIGPMLAELGRIRDRGYGVDEGEMELGVRCVAVPIGGVPLMAVSISGPSVRVTTDVVRAIAPALVRAGTRLAELLPDR